ncbi:hypothetical protein LCGC14_1523280, partial [marine sediment metagenome]
MFGSALRVALGQGLRVVPLVGVGFLIQDVKDEGVAGGTSSTGANTRVLNTVIVNTIPGAFLGSNQFTLDTGDYEIEAYVPTINSGRNRLYLYNVTDASVILIGQSCFSNLGGTAGGGMGFLRGRITLAATKTLELRQEIETGEVTNGFGVAMSDGVNKEVYATIYISEVSTVQNLLHVRDKKSTTVDGGTPSVGNNIRALNDAVTNEISGASVASDQITLGNGAYEIKAFVPCFR